MSQRLLSSLGVCSLAHDVLLLQRICSVSTVMQAGMTSLSAEGQLHSSKICHFVSSTKGLISAMQSDPDLLSRTESEVQQLAQDMEKLRLAMQSQFCNGQ